MKIMANLTASTFRVRSERVAAMALAAIVGLSAGSEPRLPQPLPEVQHPANNPPSDAKIALGRDLFFDARLSRTERVSCATCHDPQKSFSNGERFAAGVDGKRGTRNVPGLTNVGYGGALFWDGRADSLERQALAPIENSAEMDVRPAALAAKLNGIEAYRVRFRAAFGGDATPERIAQALAAFQRTIVSRDTPFDRHLRGEPGAMDERLRRGMNLFFGEARCSVCHSGPNLTDDRYHNVVASPTDAGRRTVTGNAKDQGAFRTPQLREVAHTAPYMHDGRFQTLAEVVQHYNFGGVGDVGNDDRDPELQVLYLSADQVDDLVAFLAEGLSTPKGKR